MQINQKPGMFIEASKQVFEKAKVLRNNMTLPEKMLWEELKAYKKAGFKFRRQHPIHDFVADFYCHSAKLVIEIDGINHHLINTIEDDKLRTEILNENGVKVIRFINEEVLSNMKSVLKQIELEIGIFKDT